MSQVVQWGVLGFARIARNSVIPAIQRSHNGNVVALASRDPAKLAEAGKEFVIPNTYTRYEDVLTDSKVQAVYIPLPNSQHCEWAIKAMEAGKHVLCEKPLALNAADARRMVDAARASGRILMEAFMYRYSDRTRQVEAVLKSGKLGEIRHINASFRFLLNRANTIKIQPELGGGALYDVGCYPINLLGLVTGGLKPVACHAEASFENGVDNNLSAVLRYENGIVAALHCGFNAHPFVRAEIIGTEGVLEIPDPFLDMAGELTLRTAHGVERIAVAESNRYLEEVEDFSAAVLENRQPKFTLDESIRNMEVLDMLYASLPRP